MPPDEFALLEAFDEAVAAELERELRAELAESEAAIAEALDFYLGED